MVYYEKVSGSTNMFILKGGYDYGSKFEEGAEG